MAKEVVFDGDQKGDNAKGWAVPEGKATIQSQDKEVRTAGEKTVEFHAEGNEWLGGGWNWFGWSPEDAGTDISKFSNLSFWAKVTGDKKPTELKVGLGANDKTATEQVTHRLLPQLMDGKSHEVVIPIKDLDTKNALTKIRPWHVGGVCPVRLRLARNELLHTGGELLGVLRARRDVLSADNNVLRANDNVLRTDHCVLCTGGDVLRGGTYYAPAAYSTYYAPGQHAAYYAPAPYAAYYAPAPYATYYSPG